MTSGSMTGEEGARKRGRLVRDGYCHIEGVLPEDFLAVLREESDRLLDAVDHPPKWHSRDPISMAPWPQPIFLSYYLVDTDFENGCFRVIPGTHRRRIPLHGQVEVAHLQTAYFADVQDPRMFGDHPDAVDLPVKAADRTGFLDGRGPRSHRDSSAGRPLRRHANPRKVPGVAP